jgi:hypothetical protein
MSVTQVEVEPRVFETATDEDFSYPEHAPRWIWPGVCSVCGVIGQWDTIKAGNFQDPFPSLGSDEYLTW